jgi:hypothetical protein
LTKAKVGIMAYTYGERASYITRPIYLEFNLEINKIFLSKYPKSMFFYPVHCEPTKNNEGPLLQIPIIYYCLGYVTNFIL